MTVEELRAKVVAIAESYVGPQDPDRFWSRVCPKLCGNPHLVSWGGGFALSCLHEAGITDKPWTRGKGFLLTPPKLPRTNQPKPGDIAYFDDPVPHHAIVREVTEEMLFTVEGNHGRSDDEVVELCARPRKSSDVYFSIGLLIAAMDESNVEVFIDGMA
jgi:hypothetical protein